MRKKILMLFFALAFILNNLHAQSSFITGVVKELHATTINDTRPIKNASVILRTRNNGVTADRTTDNGAFKIKAVKDLLDTIDCIYNSYQLVDRDNCDIIWSDDKSNNLMSILLSKPGRIQEIISQISKPNITKARNIFKKQLDSVISIYKKNLKDAKDIIKELQGKLIDQEARINVYSELFAKTDLTEADSTYYKAFLFFKQGNIDSCENILSPSFIDSEIRNLNKKKKLLILALIIKAQSAEDKNNAKEAEKCYLTALDSVEYNKTTVNAYGNFLKKSLRISEAIPILESKFSIPRKPISFEDSIYTYYQITCAYAYPMNVPDKYYYYDSIVYSKRNRILESKDFLQISYLIRVMEQMAEYNSNRRIKTGNNIFEYNFINIFKESLNIRLTDSLAKLDSLNITSDISECAYEIALTYEEIFNNKDSARKYYLLANNLIKNKFIKYKSNNYAAILMERYEDYLWSEKFTKREKKDYLTNEISFFNRTSYIEHSLKNILTVSIRSLIENLSSGVYD